MHGQQVSLSSHLLRGAVLSFNRLPRVRKKRVPGANIQSRLPACAPRRACGDILDSNAPREGIYWFGRSRFRLMGESDFFWDFFFGGGLILDELLEFFHAGKLTDIFEAEVNQEFSGGLIKDGPSENLFAAGGGDKLFIEQRL